MFRYVSLRTQRTENNFCPMQEEPGGQRALVFDQGNRISQVRFIYSFFPAVNKRDLFKCQYLKVEPSGSNCNPYIQLIEH